MIVTVIISIEEDKRTLAKVSSEQTPVIREQAVKIPERRNSATSPLNSPTIPIMMKKPWLGDNGSVTSLDWKVCGMISCTEWPQWGRWCVRHNRVLSRIYRLGEKFRGAEGDELLRGGAGGMPPGNFWNEYALRCNLVHFYTQFWEVLQCVHWPRRVWMIFPI